MSFLIHDPLKMGPIGCLETSVRNYHCSLRHSPEERSFHFLHGGSQKSQNNEPWILKMQETS